MFVLSPLPAPFPCGTDVPPKMNPDEFAPVALLTPAKVKPVDVPVAFNLEEVDPKEKPPCEAD